jgi:hypothetical protein
MWAHRFIFSLEDNMPGGGTVRQLRKYLSSKIWGF